MTCFVDTSAVYAVLDRDDANHAAAASQFAAMRGEALVTHNYVLVETAALVQRRLGLAVLRRFFVDVVPVLRVVWVDEHLHTRASTEVMVAGRRRVSLVDRVSFEVMRACGITTAFVFDDDFRDEGFAVVPSS